VVTLPALAAPVAAPGPTRAEVDQATGDVDRDLATLANDSQLKDIAPELRGWRQSINAIVAEGLAAAQTALDPRARDRAFAARRQLGD